MATTKPSPITTLPPELYLNIFDHLPTRTIRTTLSPLQTTIRHSPSIKHLKSISQTNRLFRQITNPILFDAISIKSFQQLQDFISSGTPAKIGRFTRRLTIRWENSGEIIPQETYFSSQGQQNAINVDGVIDLVTVLMKGMPGVRSLQMDFPGAFDGLAAALADAECGRELRVVNLRYGRCMFGGDIGVLMAYLGRVDGLKSLSLDGNFGGVEDRRSIRRDFEGLGIYGGEFRSLVALEISAVKSFDDGLLRWVVGSARSLTSLSVKNCCMVSLRGTRSLLVDYGTKLKCLSLEILKGQQDGSPSAIMEEEHLCPVIRDYCRRVQVLEVYTNKICNDILFPTAPSESGAMTGGLPTPPGNTGLAPVNAGLGDIPTPPADGILSSGEISPALLPPPLFDFASASKLERYGMQSVWNGDERKGPMKNVSLGIPYDVSCFGPGSRGPSLQQTFTRLCDGMPAKELLEIGKKAFEEGLAEVVKIRGHWKGGPYLIMAD